MPTQAVRDAVSAKPKSRNRSTKKPRPGADLAAKKPPQGVASSAHSKKVPKLIGLAEVGKWTAESFPHRPDIQPVQAEPLVQLQTDGQHGSHADSEKQAVKHLPRPVRVPTGTGQQRQQKSRQIGGADPGIADQRAPDRIRTARMVQASKKRPQPAQPGPDDRCPAARSQTTAEANGQTTRCDPGVQEMKPRPGRVVVRERQPCQPVMDQAPKPPVRHGLADSTGTRLGALMHSTQALHEPVDTRCSRQGLVMVFIRLAKRHPPAGGRHEKRPRWGPFFSCESDWRATANTAPDHLQLAGRYLASIRAVTLPAAGAAEQVQVT